jgi:diguanylate cyclase (GGDEF)-like protein/PAS domain S-box-containing protein
MSNPDRITFLREGTAIVCRDRIELMPPREVLVEKYQNNSELLNALATFSPELFSVELLQAFPVPIAIARAADGSILYANERFRTLIGLTPAETIAHQSLETYFDSATWSALWQSLVQLGSVINCEVKLRAAEGRQLWGLVSLQLLDRPGEALALATLHDITARKRAEANLQLLQTLTQAIGEARDFDTALESTIERVCQANRWVYGEAWVPQAQNAVLELRSVWSAKMDSAIDEFRQQSRAYQFAKSQDLPGKVWLSRRPLWLPDVSQEPTFLRREIARAAGLKAGFGLPLPSNGEAIAVLVFFTRTTCPEDRRLVELLAAATEQLGAILHRRQMETALKESERRLASLMNATEGIFFAAANDPGWTMTYISEGCEALTGYKSEELIGRRTLSFSEIVHPEDLPGVMAAIDRGVARETAYTIEYRLRAQAGEEKWVWEKGHGVYGENGEVLGLEGFITDITERKQSEKALQQAEMKYRSIFENALEGIFQTTPDGQYLSANPALARIYGYDSVEELMVSLQDIEHQLYVNPQQREEFVRLMQEQKEVTAFESEVYRRDRSIIWISENARAVCDNNGNLLYYEGMVEDITERKQAKEQLHARAYYDPLTKLPNRALFESRLQAALDRAKTEAGDRFAVLFLDLDRFKDINDSLGHLVGDQLLVAIARRLEHCLRENDTVARLGGDEFIILLEAIETVPSVLCVAQRIVQELTAPFHLSGHPVLTSTSIGIAFSHPLTPASEPDDSAAIAYNNPDELLRDADTALYRAKALGRGRYEVFNSKLKRKQKLYAPLSCSPLRRFNEDGCPRTS